MHFEFGFDNSLLESGSAFAAAASVLLPVEREPEFNGRLPVSNLFKLKNTSASVFYHCSRPICIFSSFGCRKEQETVESSLKSLKCSAFPGEKPANRFLLSIGLLSKTDPLSLTVVGVLSAVHLLPVFFTDKHIRPF